MHHLFPLAPLYASVWTLVLSCREFSTAGSQVTHDIATIESAYREAARIRSITANDLIASLKTIHAANERNYKSIEEQITTALTAAGYHRFTRGPWRKARTHHPVSATPNTQYPIPQLVARIEACRIHLQAIEHLYHSTPTGARSKTAARIIARYSRRALNRLTAAERSLTTLNVIIQRDSSTQNAHR